MILKLPSQTQMPAGAEQARTWKRRKPSTTWDKSFPDRRTAEANRRKREADVAAFTKAVADRHKAYVALSQAEADWTKAERKLAAATDEREKAIAALDAHKRTQKKR